jgi:hypothetical protein
MRDFYPLERYSPVRSHTTWIALMLAVIACASGMLRIPAAQAQFNMAFGSFKGDGTILPAPGLLANLSRLSLVSGFHDSVETMVGWIIGTGEETGRQVIPAGVALHAIPGHSTYRYAVIGGQRLVVDAATRAVIYVVD